jgi:uncharacterized protein (DUF58 family)
VTLSPDRALLHAIALWTCASIAVVVWPRHSLWLWGSGGLLVVVAVADRWGLWRRARVEVERVLPESARVGRGEQVRLVMRNGSASPRTLELYDEVPPDLAAVEPHFTAVQVAANSTSTLSYDVLPRCRGEQSFGPIVYFERSPLGLWRRRALATPGQTLRVLPDTQRLLAAAALDPQTARALAGVKPMRRRGEGFDFQSLRDYLPGDDPRRIDWAASARRARPVVRLHRDEQQHAILLAVDTSRLMGGGTPERTKLDHAIDAALTLAYTALAAGDRVGLAIFDADLRGFLAPRGGRSSIGALVDLVTPLQARAVEADYAQLARSIATHQQQRALIVVLTDFVEADGRAISGPLGVLAARHRVLLVALRDPVLTAPGADVARPDGTSLDPYRRLVREELLREREVTLGRLRRQGVETLDVEPTQITAPVLNRYLEVRHGAEA